MDLRVELDRRYANVPCVVGEFVLFLPRHVLAPSGVFALCR